MLWLLACTSGGPGPGSKADSDSSPAVDDSSPIQEQRVAGCGNADYPASGQHTLDAGPEGDGERGYTLSLPADYDPDIEYALVVGYPGTNWLGSQVQPYLDLERGNTDTLFVYLDPLWRDFSGWGNYGGWVLGPHAWPADGMQDIVFTEALLDHMEATYCVDTERVFSTGHSWGGDMSQVVSCFLGDRFTASVPVAANRPYWFEPSGGGEVGCVGETQVWTFFGVADDHFTSQAYPGEYGDECVDFWKELRGCDDEETELGYGEAGECVGYGSCSSEVRYCLYGPQSKHQVPSYYSEATMTWFRSF